MATRMRLTVEFDQEHYETWRGLYDEMACQGYPENDLQLLGLFVEGGDRLPSFVDTIKLERV